MHCAHNMHCILWALQVPGSAKQQPCHDVTPRCPSKNPTNRLIFFGVLSHERIKIATNAPKVIFKKNYPHIQSTLKLETEVMNNMRVYLPFNYIKSSRHHPHPIDPEMWGEWPHGIEFRWDTKSPNFLLSPNEVQVFGEVNKALRDDSDYVI